MAQAPIKLDAIQIEPESGDTITISRSEEGDLQFTDAKLTDAVSLARLAGMAGNAAVLVVGDNAQYSSIQDAVDAVPANSSASNQHTILVTGGLYAENITVQKDGISIVGVGLPTVSVASGDAVTLSADVSTRPTMFSMEGLRIAATEDGASCVRIEGGAGSTIGSDRILLKDLELQPSGVGSRSLRASTVGNIIAVGGDWSPTATTLIELDQCARVVLKGLSRINAVSVSHTDAAAVSGTSAVGYFIQECGEVGDVLMNLTGESSALISGCPRVGDVTFGGDQSGEINASRIGDLTLNNSFSVSLNSTSYGDMAGDGSAKVSGISGSVAFAASASETVSFDVSQPDIQYIVCIECSMAAAPSVAAKTIDGFTIGFDGLQTGTVGWAIIRSTA